MTRRFDSDDLEPVPLACGPTVERVQAVLDGELPADALTADPHAAGCANCRERIRAARLLLTMPASRVVVPAGLTDAILAGVRADRRARSRRRVFALAGGFAAAAAVVVAVWVISAPGPQVVQNPAPNPESTSPVHPPIRVGDELAKASDAIQESSRALAEPVAAAPQVVAALIDPLFQVPAGPVPGDAEPVRQALADIPDAARVGLEPVTDSAQKAFTRLLRDVGAIQPKPKS